MKSELNLSSLSTPIIGVDEVGRGCLAGPVVAAAVIFKSDIDIDKYKDSKKLSAEQRKELSISIHENHIVSIGWGSVEEVDQYNILQANFMAMRRAIEGLKLADTNGTILVDGRDIIPKLVGFKQLAIIKGDQKYGMISAASIAAKVARDDFMSNLALQFGNYGFEKHKGYGTLSHRQQIQKHGPCQWHRKSFAGVKEYL